MQHDDQDSFINNWHYRQNSFAKNLARRALFFFKRFDTTGKTFLKQICYDGQDSLKTWRDGKVSFSKKFARLALRK